MSDILKSKVSAQSLVDVLVERIEAAIVGGDLQPGSKLSEQGLAASLGVSRGPLREAIRRLEGRKLLERTPNIGVRVARLSLKEDDWNDVELAVANEQVQLRLNSELIFERPIEPTSDRRFGLFHFKGQTAVEL